MIDKIVERITLTKEDIHGMINDAMSKKGSSNPKINFYFGDGEEILNKVFGKFLSNIKYVKDQTYTANLSLIDLEDILESDMQYSTAYNINRGYIMYGKGPKYQMQIFDPPANLEQLLLKPEFKPGERKSTVTLGIFSNAETFSNFIRERYLSEGQSISGLDAFYKAVMLSKDSNKLKELIESTETNKTLQQGEYPIAGTEAELYDILKQTVKIPNGQETELWVAIVFKGLVVGAAGLTPDVDVDGQTISLKDYGRNVFDFGSLDPETIKYLNKFISLAHLLTDVEINASITAPSINAVLDKLETDAIQNQIKDLLELSKVSKIPVIDKLASQIKSLLNTTNPEKGVHNLVVSFCNDIDRLLEMKIKGANWWGMVLNKKLYLESSESVFNSIKCTPGHRLSKAITQFKSNHIYVNGLYLGSKISTKK
jgi:hypothetical protein